MQVKCAFCHASIDTEDDDYLYDPESGKYYDTPDCYSQQMFNEDKIEIYEDGHFWSEGYMGVEEDL